MGRPSGVRTRESDRVDRGLLAVGGGGAVTVEKQRRKYLSPQTVCRGVSQPLPVSAMGIHTP